MFLGEFKVKFTGLGRIVLPVKFRENLNETRELVLSRGLDGCIWGFAKSDWEKEATKQLNAPITDKTARDLRRYLFSAAELVKLDDQGRFIIPKSLIDYADLNQVQLVFGQVVLIGAGDHFEIWKLDIWQSYLTNLMKNQNET